MNADEVITVCDSLGLTWKGPFPGGARGPHISISCPLAPTRHGDPYDKNLSCSIRLDEASNSLARCHSWNCDFKGSFFRLIQLAVNQVEHPTEEALKLVKWVGEVDAVTPERLLDRESIKIEGDFKRSLRALPPQLFLNDADVLPESALDFCSGSIPRYALDRGISIETAKCWELGYDEPRKRLVFPVRAFSGELVGMTGRDITDDIDRTKYHNYSGLNKTRYLYGAHLLRQKTPVVICEGPIDAVRVFQALDPDYSVVGSLGQGFSNEHGRVLAAANPPLALIFTDNDAAGQHAADKIIRTLKGRFSMSLVLLPKGVKDPGELDDEAIRKCLERPIPILDRIDWTTIRPTGH